MFKFMGTDINAILGAQTKLIWTYGYASTMQSLYNKPCYNMVLDITHSSWGPQNFLTMEFTNKLYETVIFLYIIQTQNIVL